MIGMHFPLGTLTTRIERNGVHIFPSGTTRIQAGDRLTVITSKPRDVDDMAQRWGLKHLAAELGLAPERASATSSDTLPRFE